MDCLSCTLFHTENPCSICSAHNKKTTRCSNCQNADLEPNHYRKVLPRSDFDKDRIVAVKISSKNRSKPHFTSTGTVYYKNNEFSIILWCDPTNESNMFIMYFNASQWQKDKPIFMEMTKQEDYEVHFISGKMMAIVLQMKPSCPVDFDKLAYNSQCKTYIPLHFHASIKCDQKMLQKQKNSQGVSSLVINTNAHANKKRKEVVEKDDEETETDDEIVERRKHAKPDIKDSLPFLKFVNEQANVSVFQNNTIIYKPFPFHLNDQ